MAKRIGIATLALALALAALLAGCQSAAPQPTAAPSQAASQAPEASPVPTQQIVDLSMICQIPPEIVLDDNPLVAEIGKQLGIRLHIEAPPLDGFGDRVKVVVSTGDMPDLFIYGADVAAAQWAQQGLILDVTEKIKDYPNIVANITKQQMGDCEFLSDGHYYGIPRPNSYDSWGFLINKKWLDKVGLQAPTTVAEFEAVCKAFTENDPDGNGKADTFGVSFGASASSVDSGVWHLQNDFLSTAYNISSWHAALPDKDGGFSLRALKEQYYDYLTELRNLYSKNIIDREFITFNNANENVERFAQQRVGIVGASEKNYTTNVLEKYNLNLDDYVYCAPLVLNKGDKAVYAMPPSNWMAYYVNAKTEKWADCLRLIDWGNSEEGFVLQHMGIAGTHYNSYDVQTRTVERTKEQADALTKVTSNMFGFANAFKGQEALTGGSTKEQIAKWQKESAAAEAVTRKCYMPFFKIVDQVGIQFPDVAQTLNTNEVRYVTGEIPLEDLKAYVEGEYTTKTADIEKQFEEYMTKNPVEWKD
jgi:putative aldouronate transport system substrate-binding protein